MEGLNTRKPQDPSEPPGFPGRLTFCSTPCPTTLVVQDLWVAGSYRPRAAGIIAPSTAVDNHWGAWTTFPKSGRRRARRVATHLWAAAHRGRWWPRCGLLPRSRRCLRQGHDRQHGAAWPECGAPATQHLAAHAALLVVRLFRPAPRPCPLVLLGCRHRHPRDSPGWVAPIGRIVGLLRPRSSTHRSLADRGSGRTRSTRYENDAHGPGRTGGLSVSWATPAPGWGAAGGPGP